MKKLWIGLAAALAIAVLIYGYSAIRTLNGNPLSMPKARSIAGDYLKHAYPGEDLRIGSSTIRSPQVDM